MAASVLHISESDISGGAARAAYKIHDSLRSLGHSSRMLVGRRVSSDPDVRSVKRNVAWRAADRAFGTIGDAASLQYTFYPSSFGVARDPWFRTADIVHLHNLHGSYFGYTALPLLTRLRPTVWLLHDMWPLTGHVAYSYDCDRWLRGCGSCPYRREYPPLRHDTTALLWRLKRAVYARSRLTVVTPSKWLADVAARSPLLARFPRHVIPYAVDTDTFHPAARAEARAAFGLPPDRAVVLFVGSAADSRKGFRLLEQAVARLDPRPLVVVAGTAVPDAPVEVVELGELTDAPLAAAYRAADVTALPSLADNLPNVALESLAVGTPCVAFDVGGIAEAVRHLETGWVAPARDVASLAEGLETLLSDDALRDRLGRRSRERAVTEYGLGVQARRYQDLYDHLLRAA